MINQGAQTDTCRFPQNDRLPIENVGQTGKKPASYVIFCAWTAKNDAWVAIFGV